MLPIYRLISRTLYNTHIGAKIFPIQDDYALNIYRIVVHIDICIYSLQVANTKLYITNVKRNSINQHTVNNLSSLNVYCVIHDSRIF